MALVEVDQDVLNQFATNLETAIQAVSTELASLQAEHPAADLSALNQAFSDLQALQPPAPAPADSDPQRNERIEEVSAT